MTALLMFGGFALLLILGVPIALSLGRVHDGRHCRQP